MNTENLEKKPEEMRYVFRTISKEEMRMNPDKYPALSNYGKPHLQLSKMKFVTSLQWMIPSACANVKGLNHSLPSKTWKSPPFARVHNSKRNIEFSLIYVPKLNDNATAEQVAAFKGRVHGLDRENYLERKEAYENTDLRIRNLMISFKISDRQFKGNREKNYLQCKINILDIDQLFSTVQKLVEECQYRGTDEEGNLIDYVDLKLFREKCDIMAQNRPELQTEKGMYILWGGYNHKIFQKEKERRSSVVLFLVHYVPMHIDGSPKRKPWDIALFEFEYPGEILDFDAESEEQVAYLNYELTNAEFLEIIHKMSDALTEWYTNPESHSVVTQKACQNKKTVI